MYVIEERNERFSITVILINDILEVCVCVGACNSIQRPGAGI